MASIEPTTTFAAALTALRSAGRIVRGAHDDDFEEPEVLAATNTIRIIAEELMPFIEELLTVGNMDVFVGTIGELQAWLNKQRREWLATDHADAAGDNLQVSLELESVCMNGSVIQLNAESIGAQENDALSPRTE